MDTETLDTVKFEAIELKLEDSLNSSDGNENKIESTSISPRYSMCKYIESKPGSENKNIKKELDQEEVHQDEEYKCHKTDWREYKSVSPTPTSQVKTTYNCKVCIKANYTTKKFADQNALDIHTDTKHRCKVCLKFFRDPRNLISHSSVHSPQDQAIYKCEHCEKSFTTEFFLVTHLLQLHEEHPVTKYKTYPCELCQKILPSQKLLERHVIKKHVVDKSFECSQCSQMFVDEEDLAHHVKRAHEEPFRCRYCEKTFVSFSSHKHHEKTHEGVKENTCEICQKSFTFAVGLRMHMANYHGAEKPFKCRLCDKRWIIKSQLDRHLLTHTEERLFGCDKCDGFYKSPSTLKKHQREVHEKVTRKWKRKKKSRQRCAKYLNALFYECNACSFETKELKETAVHNAVHGFPRILLSMPTLCAQHRAGISDRDLKFNLVAPAFSGSSSLRKETSRRIRTRARTRTRNMRNNSESFDEVECVLCDVSDCDSESRSEVNLPKSKVQRERTIRQRFRCEICSKSFLLYPCMRQHGKIH